MTVFCSQEELGKFGKEFEQRHIELFKSNYLPHARHLEEVSLLLSRVLFGPESQFGCA